jgi:PAS domain S-box-containing protein
MPLLEAMTESVLVTTTDPDSPGPSIVYVNPAFERMTGWAMEEVIGKSPRILQGTKTEHSVFIDLRERLVKGISWFGQTTNYRKDGSEHIMHCLVGRCCLKQLDTASNLTLIAIAKLNIHIIFGQLDLWQESTRNGRVRFVG